MRRSGRAAHAVSTYRQFIIENEAMLRQLPAPRIAQQYYLSDDPYLYNMDSALCRGPVEAEPRRPPCDNLYDVFCNILEDEWVRLGLRSSAAAARPWFAVLCT